MTFLEWSNKKEEEIRKKGESLLNCAKIDNSYDIPYLAGYNTKGTKFFIDKDLPKVFKYKGKNYDIFPFLLRHESVEKAAMIELGLGYKAAHAMATKAEREKVEEAGIVWKDYQKYVGKYIKKDGHKKLTAVPSSLDMTPYECYDEKPLIKTMKTLMAKNKD